MSHPHKGKKVKRKMRTDDVQESSIFNVFNTNLLSTDLLKVDLLFGVAEKEPEDTSFKFFNVLLNQLYSVFSKFQYNRYIGQLFCKRLNQASNLIFNEEDGLVTQLKDQLQVTIANNVIKTEIKDLETVLYNAIKYFTRYTKSNSLTYLLVGFEFKNELFKFDTALRTVFEKLWEQYTFSESIYKLESSWELEDTEFFCNLTHLIELRETTNKDTDNEGDNDDDEDAEEMDQVSIDELFEFNGTTVEEVTVYLNELKDKANKMVTFRAQHMIQQRALFEFWIGSFKEAVLVTQSMFLEKCVAYLKDQFVIDDTRATALCQEFLNIVNNLNNGNPSLSTKSFSLRTLSVAEIDALGNEGILMSTKALYGLSNEKTIELVDIARLCRPIDSTNLDLSAVLTQINKLQGSNKRRFYPSLNSVMNESLLEIASHQTDFTVDQLKIIWEVKEKGHHSKKAIDEKNLLCELLLNSRGWVLAYGPKKSGKTLKLVASCHELSQRKQAADRDLIYVNMAGCCQNEVDCIARVTSQLFLQCTHSRNITRQDSVTALKIFLHQLPVGSVIIFDNFSNEDEHEFGVDEVYFIDNKVALLGHSATLQKSHDQKTNTTPSSLDYFISIYGSVLEEYEYKFCFVLGYSSNGIEKVNTLFRTANRSHKCCICAMDIDNSNKTNVKDKDDDSSSTSSIGFGGAHTTGNVISAYFEIGPLSNNLAEILAKLLLPIDPNTLLTASQNVSGKMIELTSLFYYKDIRNIGKIVTSFFNTKTKRFHDIEAVVDDIAKDRPLLKKSKSKRKSKRKSMLTSTSSEGAPVLFAEEIIRGLSVNTLNRLTRNELLFLCCLLSATLKKTTRSSSSDEHDNSTMETTETGDNHKDIDVNIVVDGNVMTKTQNITVPGLVHAVLRSQALKSNLDNIDDHTIGSLLHNSFFDAGLIWSLCRDSFDGNLLHWYIALNSLIDTGFVHYEPELGYYLSYLYQPIEIALTNQTDREKLALEACQVDSKQQIYIYLMHYISELQRVNCQSTSSIDSGLSYFDKYRYHFRQVIVAFMSSTKNAASSNADFNNKLTFALCGGLSNVLTHRIEVQSAVELCLQVLRNIQSIISSKSKYSDKISEEFGSPLDIELNRGCSNEYFLYLHFVRAWYDGITQHLRQKDGVSKAATLMKSLKEDQENLDQLPILERVKLMQLQGYLLDTKHNVPAALQCFEEALQLIKPKNENFKIKNKPNFVIMKELLDNLNKMLDNSVNSLSTKADSGKCCVIN